MRKYIRLMPDTFTQRTHMRIYVSTIRRSDPIGKRGKRNKASSSSSWPVRVPAAVVIINERARQLRASGAMPSAATPMPTNVCARARPGNRRTGLLISAAAQAISWHTRAIVTSAATIAVAAGRIEMRALAHACPGIKCVHVKAQSCDSK